VATIVNDFTDGSGNDTLIGIQGNDWISARGGNDFIRGGSENDTLVGASGSDVFNFFSGEGSDSILHFGPSIGGIANDRLDFGDLNIAQLKTVFGNYINTDDDRVSRVGNDLALDFDGSSHPGQIYLDDYFDSAAANMPGHLGLKVGIDVV
jgi:Ca2+-binding RTX toxin-like protein